MTKIKHDVIIVGAGPTGLMLAAELALAGIDAAIVERRFDHAVEGSRAGGLHPRTIEILDQRGIADRFLAAGERHYVVPFAGTMLDGSDRPTRHNFTLAIWQEKVEQLLGEWIEELKVPIYRSRAVVDFASDESGVDLSLDDGSTMRAAYLVGCDGGRGLVRKKAGIAFPGHDAEISYLIFEADMSGEPAWGIRHGPRGLYALGRLDDGIRVRGVVTEQQLEKGHAEAANLRAALTAAYGSDFGVDNVTWLSRFTDAARLAASYRCGRILLAGDAAHVHSPAGGQGLNIGMQDAANLGWKLAQVVKGQSPDKLLDTYHDERHPVGAALLEQTLALTALNRGDDRSNALRSMMATVLQMDAPRRWFTAQLSGLDVRYDLGEGSALLGRRMPDLDLVTPDGPTTVFALLHEARPLLIDFAGVKGLDSAFLDSRTRCVAASFEGEIDLPVVGKIACPDAVLLRPDGHVAWVGDGSNSGLADALDRWCGNRL